VRPTLLASVIALAFALPAASQAKTPLPGVVTPSGNIHCFYVPGPPGHLLCDIHQASYNAREQAGCMARSGLDWHGWEVYATRKTLPVCSGGILYNSNSGFPRYTKLAYGKSWHFAAFTCTSRTSGLTCSAHGHGIFISRASWRGW
jgi:hypothetical protein